MAKPLQSNAGGVELKPDKGPAHLYSNMCHDEADVWCDDPVYFRGLIEPVRSPDKATCAACLEAAAKFGSAAQRRLANLKYAQMKGVGVEDGS